MIILKCVWVDIENFGVILIDYCYFRISVKERLCFLLFKKENNDNTKHARVNVQYAPSSARITVTNVFARFAFFFFSTSQFIKMKNRFV